MIKSIRVWASATLLVVAAAALMASGDTEKTANDASSDTTAASDAPAAPATRQPLGTTATLGAGSYVGGSDVAVGLYDVTAGRGQQGNFIVSGKHSYNEILGGGDLGVDKVRVQVSKDDSIKISGLSAVTFTVVTSPFVTTQGPVAIYAGTWTVGEDVAPGRYVATPGAGQSGNFIITDEGVNEILGGGDLGVPSVRFTVKKGDVIAVGSLSTVNLAPA